MRLTDIFEPWDTRIKAISNQAGDAVVISMGQTQVIYKLRSSTLLFHPDP